MLHFPDKTQLLTDDQAAALNTSLNISPQTTAVLALIHNAPDTPFSSLTRVHKLLFIAQNGGLEYCSDSYSSNYPALPEQFPFKQHIHGPHSKRLNDHLDRLERNNLLNITEVTTPAGNTRNDYELTSTGEQALEYALEHFDDTHLKTITHTLDIYYDMSMFLLVDLVSHEGENKL